MMWEESFLLHVFKLFMDSAQLARLAVVIPVYHSV